MTADGHAVVLKVWAKRHRDLSRTRNQVVCRLHAVLCELIPGGVPDEITAGQAARILEQVAPAGAVAQARCELAAELLADIRHLDAQRREVKKKLAAAVTASGTSLTEVFGVGPVIAATVIGDVITVARFPSRDHFAACNGTAPVEVSSGQRKIYRLSRPRTLAPLRAPARFLCGWPIAGRSRLGSHCCSHSRLCTLVVIDWQVGEHIPNDRSVRSAPLPAFSAKAHIVWLFCTGQGSRPVAVRRRGRRRARPSPGRSAVIAIGLAVMRGCRRAGRCGRGRRTVPGTGCRRRCWRTGPWRPGCRRWRRAGARVRAGAARPGHRSGW